MNRFSLRLLPIILLAGALSAAPAHAQLRQVLDLNRQAMDAYTNMEVEQSMDLLRRALRAAQSGGVEGSPLATTHANLGIVAVGGFGDNAGGLQHFMDAVRADANIELDPLNSTPDIQSVFLLARNRVNNSGTTNNNTNTNNNNTNVNTAPGQIPHAPPAEQLTNTAIPIFVEVPDSAPVSGITVHYQSPGMPSYRSVEMRRMAGGFGLELPCAEVMAPRVTYYLEAFDEDGSPMGVAGTLETPFTVEVVGLRTMPAPALPGQPPPSQCIDNECPPGMECNNEGTAGLGDTCHSGDDCRSGLMCRDDFCIAQVEDGGGGPIDDGEMPRFFADVGFSLGLGLASSGRRADTDGDSASYVNPGVGDCPDDGFDCVRLEQSGLLTTYALRLSVGYWIIPRVAVAATVRFQFDSGEGTLAGLLLGLRVMYQLTPPVGKGVHADVFLGTSYGQIQMRPNQNGETEPYMVAGLNGVQVGGNIGYRFMRNIGVALTPEIHLLFPQFLFNIDLTASVTIGF